MMVAVAASVCAMALDMTTKSTPGSWGSLRRTTTTGPWSGYFPFLNHAIGLLDKGPTLVRQPGKAPGSVDVAAGPGTGYTGDTRRRVHRAIDADPEDENGNMDRVARRRITWCL